MSIPAVMSLSTLSMSTFDDTLHASSSAEGSCSPNHSAVEEKEWTNVGGSYRVR